MNVYLYGGPRHGERLALPDGERCLSVSVAMPIRELTPAAQAAPIGPLIADYVYVHRLRDGTHLFEFAGWRL